MVQRLCYGHRSTVSTSVSTHPAHHPLIALLALGHLQHLLHLTVHAALHLPAGQDVARDLLLLYCKSTGLMAMRLCHCAM